jgi:hypothetical protein
MRQMCKPLHETSHLATLLERCGQNLASAPPFRGWNVGGVQTWRHQGPIPDRALGVSTHGEEGDDMGNEHRTSSRQYGLYYYGYNSIGHTEGHWAIIWEGNRPSDMAMNLSFTHGQIRMKSSSSKVQSMNRAAVSGYYKTSFNIRTKNIRILYQWFRGYTIMWVVASNKSMPHLVNLTHTTASVNIFSKTLGATPNSGGHNCHMKQVPYRGPHDAGVAPEPHYHLGTFSSVLVNCYPLFVCKGKRNCGDYADNIWRHRRKFRPPGSSTHHCTKVRSQHLSQNNQFIL